jgi:Ca-activated chloride channel family protein
MLAEDVAPSRLDKAKLLISKTLGILGGDRVGIVAYAGSAYPALPITTDYVAAKMALNAANPNAVPSQGTNLAAALEYSFSYFNPASPAGRFVVVFTDGEDHEALEGLELPDFPVQILLVGLGTESGGPIPMKKNGRGVTYKKDRSGEVVITQRDEKQLGELMKGLEASYLDGNLTQPAINGIQAFIEGGDKADISEEIAIDYDPQFQWFLMPALLFLLLYLLLPNKIGNPLKYLSIALLLSSSTLYGQQVDSLEFAQASGDAYSYYQAIKDGNQLQEEGNLESAAKAYANAVQMNPEGFEGWYNLGSTLLKGGMAEEGEQALKESLNRTENDEQLSNSLHNLGDAAYDAQRYEEALNYYKESLLRNPTRPDAQYNFNRAFEKLQQQQNKDKNEEQNEEQQEDQQEKEPPKQDKDDPQNEDPKDDNAKDKQEQKDQSGNEGEKNKDEQKQDNGEPQESKDGKNNKPEEGGESKAKMTPEQIKGLLEAIQRAEEKTAEKANAKKAKGKKKSGEKDW